MDNQTTAASSPADVFNGQQPTMAEYSQYRESGELPERFKAATADPAPADKPEEQAAPADEESEIEPASEPGEAQEQPQKGSAAEKRIKQLLAKTKELERKLADAAKPTQSDSSTAQAPQQPPQSFDEWYQRFDVDKWEEDYAKSHPDASYSKMQLDEKLFVDSAKDHFKGIQERVRAGLQDLASKVEQAKIRYADFDEITNTLVGKVVNDKGIPLIPQPVFDMVNDSEVFADLVYMICSDEQELDKFVAMAKASPTKAIRYLTKAEALIADELAKPNPARAENGQFKPNAPEKKSTSAPKPPSPVNNGGHSRAFDPSDDSLSPEEWMRQRNKALGKG
jgi:hypothetical protein